MCYSCSEIWLLVNFLSVFSNMLVDFLSMFPNDNEFLIYVPRCQWFFLSMFPDVGEFPIHVPRCQWISNPCSQMSVTFLSMFPDVSDFIIHVPTYVSKFLIHVPRCQWLSYPCSHMSINFLSMFPDMSVTFLSMFSDVSDFIIHVPRCQWLSYPCSQIRQWMLSSCCHVQAEWVRPGRRPPSDWPAQGSVDFVNYSTRYRPGLDLVIKGVNCKIQGGEKVSHCWSKSLGVYAQSTSMVLLGHFHCWNLWILADQNTDKCKP